MDSWFESENKRLKKENSDLILKQLEIISEYWALQQRLLVVNTQFLKSQELLQEALKSRLPSYVDDPKIGSVVATQAVNDIVENEKDMPSGSGSHSNNCSILDNNSPKAHQAVKVRAESLRYFNPYEAMYLQSLSPPQLSGNPYPGYFNIPSKSLLQGLEPQQNNNLLGNTEMREQNLHGFVNEITNLRHTRVPDIYDGKGEKVSKGADAASTILKINNVFKGVRISRKSEVVRDLRRNCHALITAGYPLEGAIATFTATYGILSIDLEVDPSSSLFQSLDDHMVLRTRLEVAVEHSDTMMECHRLLQATYHVDVSQLKMEHVKEMSETYEANLLATSNAKKRITESPVYERDEGDPKRFKTVS